MDQLDRRAIEFRALQEAVLVRLSDLDLSALGDLAAELSIQEFRALEYLGPAGPRMMRELAEHLRLAVNSVTGVVDALERRGLAVRRKDEADRRVVRVELTGKGRSAAETISSGVRQIYRTYLSALTDREQNTLLTLYRKIARPGRTGEGKPRPPLSPETIEGDAVDGEGEWKYQGMSGSFEFLGKRRPAK